MITSKKQLWFNLLIPCILLYSITAYFNQVNAILISHLTLEFHLDSAEIGLLGACYLLAFGTIQIPLGLLLDRFHPLSIQAKLALLSIIGIIKLHYAITFHDLCIAELLLGFGLAGGLMSGFKYLSLHLPSTRLPLYNALVMGIGGLGCVLASTPTEIILRYLSWRYLIAAVACYTAVILIGIFLKSSQETIMNSYSFKSEYKEFVQVIKHPKFWSLGLLAASSFASMIAAASLWASTWMANIGYLTPKQIGYHLTLITVTLLMSILLYGIIPHVVNKRFKLSLPHFIAAGMCSFLMIQIIMYLGNKPNSYILWGLFGIFGRVDSLCYSAAINLFDRQITGRVITLLNTCYFMMAFLIEFGIGSILKYLNRIQLFQNLSSSYQLAFGIVLLLQFLSFVVFLTSWFKPSYTKIKLKSLLQALAMWPHKNF